MEDKASIEKMGVVEGEEIVSTGRPPWKVAATLVEIEVKNPELNTAILLDCNGLEVREIESDHDGEILRVRLPREAMYVVLVKRP